MIFLTVYTLKRKKNTTDFYVRSRERAVCPCCGQHMKLIGNRPRKVIRRDGSFFRLIIRRFRCQACSRVHHELPDFLVPYKRYTADTIEKNLKFIMDSGQGANDVKAEYPCEHSTVLRQYAWFRRLIAMLNEQPELRHRLLEFFHLNNLSASLLISRPSGWMRDLMRIILRTSNFPWNYTRNAWYPSAAFVTLPMNGKMKGVQVLDKKKNLEEMTETWMSMERKTLKQREKAEAFYEENLMQPIADRYLEKNDVFGHLGDEGKEFTHKIMSFTLNYSETVTQKFIQRRPDKPISCIKLREQYKQISAEIGCTCNFRRTKNCYPSPVLHALKQSDDNASITMSLSRMVPVEKQEILKNEINVAARVQEIAEKLIELRKQQRSLDKSVRKAEQELARIFDENNTNSMEIKMGLLIRKKTKWKVEWSIEL